MKHLILLLLASAGAALGQGRILWNESVHGPLSNLYQTPSLIPMLQMGTNSILGHSEIVRGVPSGAFPDFFQFTVPFGFRVTTLAFSGDRQASVYISDPTYFQEYGSVARPADGDLLPQLGLTELSARNYGMYVQNFDASPFDSTLNYRLDFVLAAVPEPGTWALLGLGGLAFWCLAKRRRS